MLQFTARLLDIMQGILEGDLLIGLSARVLGYCLLADETIDERMLEILSAKQKEFDAFAEDSVIGDLQMQSDTSWLTKLVQEEQSRLGQQ